jgi:hypothetical protein
MATSMDTHPKWLGHLIAGCLPDDEEPVAVYYSWDDDTRLVPVLVVLRGSLVGMELTLLKGTDARFSVTSSAVALDEVVRVSSSGRAWSVHEPGVALDRFEIELSRDLPAFGATIQLPIARNDYRGNRDDAIQAARGVADAIMSIRFAPDR